MEGILEVAIAPIPDLPVDFDDIHESGLRKKRQFGISRDIEWVVIAALIFATVISWVSVLQSLIRVHFERRRTFGVPSEREKTEILVPETFTISVSLTLITIFIILVLQKSVGKR